MTRWPMLWTACLTRQWLHSTMAVAMGVLRCGGLHRLRLHPGWFVDPHRRHFIGAEFAACNFTLGWMCCFLSG